MKNSENPIFRRVYCGDCGCALNATDNRHRENGRQVSHYCCQTRKSRENYVTREEICAALKAQLLVERQTAIEAKNKIKSLIASGRYKQLEDSYLGYIHFWMNVIQESCGKINDLCMKQQTPGPLPEELQPEYDSLYASNRKAAAYATALETESYRFRKGFRLENAWLYLYSSIPEEFDLTPGFVQTYAPRIFLFHDKHVTFRPQEEDAKNELLWCLALPDSPNSAYAAVCKLQAVPSLGNGGIQDEDQ
ncbi:MAG: hypothetical protein LUD14_05075 [Clostridiales bacterium]|nr:hypothetical protein [Clostridiales bacterium]